MPGSGRQRAVAAALCLALGSTALLTWAFSVFAEDKSKRRPGDVPSQGSPSKAAAEEPADAGSDACAEGSSGESRGDKRVPSLVTEKQSGSEPAEAVEYRYPVYEKLKQQPETGGAVDGQRPVWEVTPSTDSVSFPQNIPQLDERYNSSITRTSIADAVRAEEIKAGVVEIPPSSSLTQLVPQQDAKVTTFEEGQPATHELGNEDYNGTDSSLSSISSKSLEKAVMFPPSSNAKSRTASLSGVDNSVNVMGVKATDSMDLGSIDERDASYSRSASLSSDSPVHRRPSNTKSGKKGVGAVKEIEGQQPQPNVSGEMMEGGQPQTSEVDGTMTNKQALGVDQSTVVLHVGEGETNTIDFSQGASLADQLTVTHANRPDSGSVLQNLAKINDTDNSNTQLERSSDISGADALDLNDNLKEHDSVIKRVKVSELSSAPNTTTADDTGTTTHLSEVFADVAEVSSFYSPIHLERELTPDSLVLDLSEDTGDINCHARSQERSEMTFQLGVDKTLSSSTHGSGSNTPNQSCDSPMHKSDLFVNISHDGTTPNDKLERAEYYAPPRLERALTPDSSLNSSLGLTQPDSLERSEMRIRINEQKTQKEHGRDNEQHFGASSDQVDNISSLAMERLVAEVPLANNTIAVDIGSCSSLSAGVYTPSGITLDPSTSSDRQSATAQIIGAVEVSVSDDTKALQDLPSKQNELSEKESNAVSEKTILERILAAAATEPLTDRSCDIGASLDFRDSSLGDGLGSLSDSLGELGADEANEMSEKDILDTIIASVISEPAVLQALDPEGTSSRNGALQVSTNPDELIDDTMSKAMEDVVTADSEPLIYKSIDADVVALDPEMDSAQLIIPNPHEMAGKVTPDSEAIIDVAPVDSDVQLMYQGTDIGDSDFDEKSSRDDDIESPADAIGDENSSISSGGVEYSRTQMTETEEVIETSVEETVTMVITGVKLNPDSDNETILSMQEAVTRGLLDLENGIYHNSTSGEKISMIDAMNTGYIEMGPKKIEKSEETVKSVGIITIRTMRETMPYTIKAARDTRNGQMYHTFQASRRKILDSEKGTFTDLQSGDKMLIGDAVDLGLVDVEYDMSASGLVQEEITKTYSVHAVVDQREKSKLAFHEAVSKGLIDPDTGEYIHNITGQRVPVEEAIAKGFVKATSVDRPDEVSVDEMGSRVAERGVDAIRKKVLAPLKALHGMKH